MGGGWLVSEDTYTRTIRNPDGDTATVTYRYLSGYQRNRIQAMRGREDGGAEMDMGSIKAAAIEMAVVRWTLPFEPTADNIRRLQGDVFDRLYEYVSLDGKEPPEEPGDEDVPLGDSPSGTPAGGPSEPSA